MHPAQQKNVDGPWNVLEWNLAVLCVQVSDMALRESPPAHQANMQRVPSMSQALG